MSKKSNLKLKDYLSEDGKLDLSILTLNTVPNVNEIVSFQRESSDKQSSLMNSILVSTS